MLHVAEGTYGRIQGDLLGIRLSIWQDILGYIVIKVDFKIWERLRAEACPHWPESLPFL